MPVPVRRIVCELVIRGTIVDGAVNALRDVVIVETDLAAGLLRQVLHRLLTGKSNAALAIERGSLGEWVVRSSARRCIELLLGFYSRWIHGIDSDLGVGECACHAGQFVTVVAHAGEPGVKRRILVRHDHQRERRRNPNKIFSTRIAAEMTRNDFKSVKSQPRADIHGFRVSFLLELLQVHGFHRQQSGRVGTPWRTAGDVVLALRSCHFLHKGSAAEGIVSRILHLQVRPIDGHRTLRGFLEQFGVGGEGLEQAQLSTQQKDG